MLYNPAAAVFRGGSISADSFTTRRTVLNLSRPVSTADLSFLVVMEGRPSDSATPAIAAYGLSPFASTLGALSTSAGRSTLMRGVSDSVCVGSGRGCDGVRAGTDGAVDPLWLVSTGMSESFARGFGDLDRNFDFVAFQVVFNQLRSSLAMAGWEAGMNEAASTEAVRERFRPDR